MIYLVNQNGLGGYNSAIDQVVQEVPYNASSEIEIDGSLVYWNQAIYLAGVGTGGVNTPVEKFSLTNGLLSSSPVAKTALSYTFFSSFSISANGAQNGILWGIEQKSAGSISGFSTRM